MIQPKTLSELARGLREQKFSSVELTKGFLDLIRKDSLNAFITVNDHALDAAKAADLRLAAGDADVLTGIPLAVKDVLMTAGLRTTAGSKMLSDYVPPYTATAVGRLQDRGMVILGKTNCDEFAMGSSNENSAFGPVKNPHDPTRVAGGSSGGSGAAVAAGLAPTALGTDTGGSVRLPAAFCGVFGLKPTYGRISRYGIIAMASSLDQVGIFAHTASDTAVMLHAMAGYDPHDATSSREAVPDYAAAVAQPLPHLTIGIPREYLADGVGRGETLIEEAKKLYRDIPQLRFVEVSLPHSTYALAAYYVIMSSEVSANLARFDGIRYGTTEATDGTLEELYRHNRSRGFGAEVRRRILLGTFALSAGYYDAYYAKAAKIRRLIRADFEKAFTEVDVILGPTSPTPAFALGEKQTDPLLMYLSDIYTVAANIAGIPALSYPAGTVDKLPMGLQFAGPDWSEGLLLQIAHTVAPLHRS